MQCPRCGTNNVDTNEFCADCGNALRQDSAVAATQERSEIPLVAPRTQAQPPTPPEYPTTATPQSGPGEQSAGERVPGWYIPPAQYLQPTNLLPGQVQPPQYSQPGGSMPGQVSPAAPGWNAPAQPDPAARPPALPQFGSLAAAGGPPGFPGFHAFPVNRTSCGVCGTALFAGQRQCGRCNTPPGAIVNPNDPTATQYLPFGPHVPLIPLFRAGEDKQADKGEQVGGWNWAAALVPTIWAAKHRIKWLAFASGTLSGLIIALYLLRAALHRTPDAGGTLTGFLIACTLIFALPRSVVLGLRGNTLAWQSRLYPDREQLRKSQRSWTVWAIIGVSILVLLLGVVAAILNST